MSEDIQIYKLYTDDREQLEILKRYLTTKAGQQASYADVVHWLLGRVDWKQVEEVVKRRW